MNIILRFFDRIAGILLAIILMPFLIIWEILKQLWLPAVCLAGVLMTGFAAGFIFGLIRAWGKV